jgi:hypothetical protein
MMFMGFVVSLLFRNYRMAAKPLSVKSPTTNTRWNRFPTSTQGERIWNQPALEALGGSRCKPPSGLGTPPLQPHEGLSPPLAERF